MGAPTRGPVVSRWAAAGTAQQLVRYLAAVSSCEEEQAAVLRAVELAAETFEAEVGVLLNGETVAASVGFPAGRFPLEDVLECVRHHEPLQVAGSGRFHTLQVPVALEGAQWTFVVARQSDRFSEDEDSLLRAMATVLSLSVGNMRRVRALRERQSLLERLSAIQRAIALRVPIAEVFDAITTAAGELLGDPLSSVYLIDASEPGTLVAASVHGEALAPLLEKARLRVGQGVVGRAVADNRLTVLEDYPAHPGADPRAERVGLTATMATPIRDGQEVIGCLVVGSLSDGRTYRTSERELLLTFAELASLAVTDARTVDELHEALGLATHRAQHDALTGLANRTRFIDRLSHALAQRRRHGPTVAVLYLDLDDFKQVNDRFGHGAGDKVLMEVADRLEKVVRGGDTVARLGGDEFAVLLEHTGGVPEAASVAQRVLSCFSRPMRVEGFDVAAGASVGLALEEEGDDSAEQLLRKADAAMYRAKHAGKGCVKVFA